MATDFRVVTPTDMGSSIKLGVKESNKYDVDLTQLDLPAGLTGLSLQGTVLTATTSDSLVTVDLAPMLPTVTAEVFLKQVQRQGNKIVFTVGEQGNTGNDTTLEVDVADLLPVVADNITVQGTGVTADPLKVKLSTTTADNVLKQAADGLYVSLADLPSAVVGKQPNTGAGITEQQFNTYLTQNLEIVEQIYNYHDGWGNWIDSPFGIRIAGQQHMIDRVGRIKGTNWLVFGSSTMT